MCESSVAISTSYQAQVFVDGGADPIFGATARMCLDTTQCSTGTISGGVSSGGASLTGAFSGSATLSKGVLSASVDPGFGFSAHDGDMWSLHVVAADGTVLVEGAKAASYSTSPPDCNGRRCVSATIQLP
ncbi:MAG TPA: hypothetical protein VLM85_34315 [Polyangiaceae bacterium]|nr:hypothetical protein [Polyangiaceae bacterium]